MHGRGEQGRGPALVSVLVVDDKAIYRSAMRDVVRATPGLELVGEAESGEAAIAATVEHSPQVVLMDKRMPGIGGLAACRAITDRDPGVIVILCSVEDPNPALAQAHGAAAMIRKQDLSRERLRELVGARLGWVAQRPDR
jgi:two-component system, NarL family, invasion response regulator UvrY